MTEDARINEAKAISLRSTQSHVKSGDEANSLEARGLHVEEQFTENQHESAQKYTIDVASCICKNLKVTVSPNDEIEAVKIKILDKGGVPSEYQRLYFAGTLLENRQTLSYYDILPGSTLIMVLTLVGGMDSAADVSELTSSEEEDALVMLNSLKDAVLTPPITLRVGDANGAEELRQARIIERGHALSLLIKHAIILNLHNSSI